MERPPFRVDTDGTHASCAFSRVSDLFYLQEGLESAGKTDSREERSWQLRH
jgi:hypothetical protein